MPPIALLDRNGDIDSGVDDLSHLLVLAVEDPVVLLLLLVWISYSRPNCYDVFLSVCLWLCKDQHLLAIRRWASLRSQKLERW
jgi:hypothetical protein